MDSVISYLGLEGHKNLNRNLSDDALVTRAVELGKGKLSQDGALMIYTGKHTGRSAKDKYVVRRNSINEIIDWAGDLSPMEADKFELLRKWAIDKVKSKDELFISTRTCGADEKHNMKANLITPNPAHNLFFHHMFREESYAKSVFEDFTIIHLPEDEVDAKILGTRSSTVVATDFDTKLVIIVGTQYAGEIKKSIFSIMNTLLPQEGILPMHAGASISSNKVVSVFFGLSGTGKTTLSTDVGSLIIGDDEHGLSESGVFNFEGGCYAKTYKLTEEGEPEIYKATKTKNAFLENVKVDENNKIDFFDKSITENGRAAYPLDFIDEIVPAGRGAKPSHMFFLTADAFGVLPPVSMLTREQAMYYFLSGYTAKLAGTEIGIQEPQATFSACFGAPFMMRNPSDYADLLGEYLEQNDTKVWLINTGWTGGVYGVGERFPLKVTRQIIRTIQSNELNNIETIADEVFGLHIPKSISGVDSNLLIPRNTWKDKNSFDKTSKELAQMFHENFKKFKKMNPSVLKGAPKFGNELFSSVGSEL